MALFSQGTIDFLVENRLRDDKAWFEEHKEQYRKTVIEPFAALVENLAPTMLEIDSRLICSPKVGGSVSRVWRDARFSRDKSLFRDSMWCMFVRQKGISLPEFFFVVTPDNFLYGCGYYSAGSASMESIRNLILTGDRNFKAALAAYESQDLFALEGDMYKKSRYPDAPEHLRDWLDRKTVCFIRYSKDFDLLFSDKLAATLSAQFKTLSPIYRFLIKAEERVER